MSKKYLTVGDIGDNNLVTDEKIRKLILGEDCDKVFPISRGEIHCRTSLEWTIVKQAIIKQISQKILDNLIRKHNKIQHGERLKNGGHFE